VSAAPRRALAWTALAASCYLLYLHNLAAVGLLGPDEPRYASIARSMARSGDWLTPRLWGEAWFEKPPLLYWMSAAGFAAGLGEDLAPRLSVALVAIGFLLLYWRVLAREFGKRAALLATAILGTSAAWIGLGHVAVTDMPLAAAFSAAMLLCLPWMARGERRLLPAAAALSGLAVLSKGLVPLVLALPLFWAGRARWRDLLRPAPAAAFLLVAAPWYVAMTAVHGRRFLDDFFVTQHFSRFASDALQHVQPFWFYVPVIIAGLFPWSPLLALLFRRPLYKDVRAQFLLLWLVFGFVFFSAAANKLPGYLLPLLPAASALIGVALASSSRASWLVAVCAALLGLVPVVADVLPQALLSGITHAGVKAGWPAVAIGSGLGLAAWMLLRRGREDTAVLVVAAGTVAAVLWLQAATYPALDRSVSARGLWRELAARRDVACVGEVNRGWRYNLNYYSVTPLPDCRTTPGVLRIEQRPGEPPYLAAASLSAF